MNPPVSPLATPSLWMVKKQYLQYMKYNMKMIYPKQYYDISSGGQFIGIGACSTNGYGAVMVM